ncbi:MAG: hypothetical protein KAX49_03915 [Halanaerobiales bacterium]|nr:hypothetical protein [Halanaerobiales bacterium]
MKTPNTALVFLSPQHHLIGLECLLNSIERNSPQLLFTHKILISENITRYDRVDEIVKIDDSLFKDMKSHVARFEKVYPKLMIFTSVFKDYDRIIYLDTDMLCLGNMDYLIGNEISKYDMLAVKDSGIVPFRNYKDNHTKINAGMFVINKSVFQKTCFDDIQKIAVEQKWKEADQDVLNELIFRNKDIQFQYLPLQFNVLKRFLVYHYQQWKEIRNGIKILHLCGRKPWEYSLIQGEENYSVYRKLDDIWWSYLWKEKPKYNITKL